MHLETNSRHIIHEEKVLISMKYAVTGIIFFKLYSVHTTKTRGNILSKEALPLVSYLRGISPLGSNY